MSVRAFLMAGALALAGCAPAQLVAPSPAQEAAVTVRVTPEIGGGDRQLEALQAPYTLTSVNHLTVKLFTVAANDVTETLAASIDLPNDGLANAALTFASLKFNTHYRLRGYAYLSAGTGTQISTDAGSQLDFTSARDTTVSLVSLPVTLNSQFFAATGSFPLGAFTSGTLSAYTTVSTLGGQPGYSAPYGVAVNAAGTVYVADFGNSRVFKISPAGVASIFLDNVTGTYTDGITGTGTPANLAIDDADNLYIADATHGKIRMATPAGVVSTYATGVGSPRCMCFDGAGVMYVGEVTNHSIYTVPAGGGAATLLAGGSGAGFADATGAAAKFSTPSGIVTDNAGSLFVVDNGNLRVRKVTVSGGVVTTFAGSGVAATTDGQGAAAAFNAPAGITIDPAGVMYVSEFSGGSLRRLTPDGAVQTLKTGIGTLQGICRDSAGVLYIADMSASKTVQKVQ